MKIYYYEYSEKHVLEAGHTLHIGNDVYLRLRYVYEMADDLKGKCTYYIRLNQSINNK
ncbi:hypothetical protein [uncultured Clostridium sp.]|uniref:hypothetical protein n=1 Tax=uncultured Clostridium sp. TaxID=59620 RepID=UPI0025DB8EC0|nr:hypothetical protein [uncultured Clostridium sp.]